VKHHDKIKIYATSILLTIKATLITQQTAI